MNTTEKPAAFRRLCVETVPQKTKSAPPLTQPPSGGCVLKHEMVHLWQHEFGPAAFRRLCVETLVHMGLLLLSDSSRLQAAVC